jgi:hypothetical protein
MENCSYLVLVYDGSEKVYIGEADRNERVCRFCGRRKPDVKFRNVAHAISESLGNTMILDNEECDDCNERLSTMEGDFYNLHAIFLSYTNTAGKRSSTSKSRTIKEKAAHLRIFNQDNIWMWQTGDKFEDQIAEIEGSKQIKKDCEFKSLPFTPHKIYQCLCKYFVGVIPSEYIGNFKQTIDWINGNITLESLPDILAYNISPISHPRIAVLIRNTELKCTPYAVGFLEFADRGYCFIVPLANNEDVPSTASTQLKNLVDLFRKIKSNTSFEPKNLSSKEKAILHMSLEIQGVEMNKNCFLYVKNENGEFELQVANDADSDK